MTFTLAAPGANCPPPRRPKPPLAPLGYVKKIPGRNGLEVWAALTADEQWMCERQDDDGTTWSVGHMPSKTVVTSCLGSLTQCRAYIASGEALADLERLQADGKGER